MTAADRSTVDLKLATRVRHVGVSAIMKVTLAANDLVARGQDIIMLGVGEPDFDTPDHIKEAAARAMWEGETKYTPADGTSRVKEAIREKFVRENGLAYTQEEIAVSSGAKQVIFNAMMATLDPGDEVIIPAPYWLSYADIVTFAGAKPVLIPCQEAAGFRLEAEQLQAALSPRTRWVFFNSPCNPSGAAYRAADLCPLLDVLLQHPQVWVLADDIYEHIVYDNLQFVTPAALEPALKARTLTVNGVSKAYAMTGWRIGYAGGPKPLIKAMGVVQSQSATCASSIGQAATVAALTGPQEIVRQRCKQFEARRDFIVPELNRIPGLSCRTPAGAFFVLANCRALIGRTTPAGARLRTDVDFAEYLLQEAGVAVIPGSVFGLDSFVRISYAASKAALQEACLRITRACARLTG